LRFVTVHILQLLCITVFVHCPWTTESDLHIQFTLCVHSCLTFSVFGSFMLCRLYWASGGTSATLKWLFQCFCRSHKARLDCCCALYNKIQQTLDCVGADYMLCILTTVLLEHLIYWQRLLSNMLYNDFQETVLLLTQL
jgi:hypothetical protein